MMTTRIHGLCFSNCGIRSVPRSAPRRRSTKARSKDCLAASATASRALLTAVTEYPSVSRLMARVLRTLISSSTTRILRDGGEFCSVIFNQAVERTNAIPRDACAGFAIRRVSACRRPDSAIGRLRIQSIASEPEAGEALGRGEDVRRQRSAGNFGQSPAGVHRLVDVPLSRRPREKANDPRNLRGQAVKSEIDPGGEMSASLAERPVSQLPQLAFALGGGEFFGIPHDVVNRGEVKRSPLPRSWRLHGRILPAAASGPNATIFPKSCLTAEFAETNAEKFFAAEIGCTQIKQQYNATRSRLPALICLHLIYIWG